MLDYLCDSCGARCKPSKCGTRSFSSILSKNSMGFDTTPTKSGVVDQNNFLCDECFASALVLAAKSLFNTSEGKRLNDFDLLIQKLAKSEKELSDKVEKVETASAEAEAKLQKAQQFVEDSKSALEAADAKIAYMEAQVKAYKLKAEATLRQRANEEKQLEIDKRENPEFVERVERRERLRASK